MKIKILLLTVFMAISFAHAASELQKLRVYAIPGQNGCGSNKEYVGDLLGEENVDIIPVRSPEGKSDFGQSVCLSYLKKKILPDENSEGFIIHASSQGTATALNYVAQEGKDGHVKALILEAVMASGNSAIHHTIKGPLMGMSWVADLPFSYYWLPYAAKGMFLNYWPAGKQPILNLENIPQTMPVVIAHSKRDCALPYAGACALYYGLRAHGNKNVYLVAQEEEKHFGVLSDKALVVQAILKKHGVYERKFQNDAVDSFDVSFYQPDYKSFKKEYDELVGKELNHAFLARLAAAGIGAGLAAGAYRVLNGLTD